MKTIIEKIKDMVQNRYTRKQISKELNISVYRLDKICKENDIKMDLYHNHSYVFNNDQISFIRKLYEDGVGADHIAAMIGINPDVIRRLIKENNMTNKKLYKLPISKYGLRKFNEDNIILTNKEKNKLYVSTMNKIMDKLDNLNFETNLYNKSQKPSDPTKNEIKYLQDHFENESIENMAKSINRSVYFVRRQIYKNRLFCIVSYKKEIKPENKKELMEDIMNPHVSNNLIAKKYDIASSSIRRIRKEKLGENYTLIYDFRKDMTTLEYSVAKLLKDNNFVYKTEYNIENMVVDFLLSHKVIIEANGDYWHRKTKARDIKKYEKLISLGYHIIAIDEEYINNNSVIEDIIDFYIGSCHEEIHGKINSVNAMCGVNKYDILYLFANGEGYAKITGIDNVRAKLLEKEEGVETIETK